jgi:hypothetical protein
MKTNKHALKYSKELNRKALEYSTSPESEIRKIQSSGEDGEIEIREDIARMKGEEEIKKALSEWNEGDDSS